MNIRKLKKKKITPLKIDKNEEEIATENLFNLSHFDDFYHEDYSTILKSIDLGADYPQNQVRHIFHNTINFVNQVNPESTKNLFSSKTQKSDDKVLLKLYSTMPDERSASPGSKSNRIMVYNSLKSDSVFVGKKKNCLETESGLDKKKKIKHNFDNIFERRFQNQNTICLRPTMYNPRSSCFSPQEKINRTHFQTSERRTSRLKTLDLELSEDFFRSPSKKDKNQRKQFFDDRMLGRQIKTLNKQIEMSDNTFANRMDAKNKNRLIGYKKSFRIENLIETRQRTQNIKQIIFDPSMIQNSPKLRLDKGFIIRSKSKVCAS